MAHVQMCCRIWFASMQRNSVRVGNVFLLEHGGVSALQYSGYRGFHLVESHHSVSDLQSRTEWTLKESETPRCPCSESSPSQRSHAVRRFVSCGIVPAVFDYLPPEQTAEMCCFVRMTKADWGPLSSPCSEEIWAVLNAHLLVIHTQMLVRGLKLSFAFVRAKLPWMY